MIILALDQASQVSGYSVFDGTQLIASGTFSISGELPRRLIKIRNKVDELIKLYNPDRVVFEDIQMEDKQKNNVLTFKALAQVIGVLQAFLTENKIKYDIVLASTWRSGVGIKGKVREVYKKNAQDYVLNKYGKSVSEDEADAICIGVYAVNHLVGVKWD